MTLNLTNATTTEILKNGNNDRFILVGRKLLDEFKDKTREEVTIMDNNNQSKFMAVVSINKQNEAISTKTFYLITE